MNKIVFIEPKPPNFHTSPGAVRLMRSYYENKSTDYPSRPAAAAKEDEKLRR